MRRLLLALGLLTSLGAPALITIRKERLAAAGEPVLLALAPSDPRALMLGDYMALRYPIARELGARAAAEGWPREGVLVLATDERGVVIAGRRYRGEAPGPGEHLLRYRLRGERLLLGAERFFFQEGEAATYRRARYGELILGPGGEAVLVGLRGEDLEVLGPADDHPLQRR